jgi:hypothetical protein
MHVKRVGNAFKIGLTCILTSLKRRFFLYGVLNVTKITRKNKKNESLIQICVLCRILFSPICFHFLIIFSKKPTFIDFSSSYLKKSQFFFFFQVLKPNPNIFLICYKLILKLIYLAIRM